MADSKKEKLRAAKNRIMLPANDAGEANDYIPPVYTQPEIVTSEPYKPHFKQKETKSRKVFILMYPSLYEKLAQEADERGMFKNDLINKILAERYEK